jgi:hypothetical protein
MPEVAGETESTQLSPDGTYAWWHGSWTPLDPRSFSPDRKWVAIEGQWRRIISAPPAQGQPAPVASSVLPQQTYPQGYAAGQRNYGSGRPNNAGNPFGVASLVLGIVWLGGLGSLLAVIFGHVARAQSKRMRGESNGLATAGLILGYLGLALAIALGISAVVHSNDNSDSVDNSQSIPAGSSGRGGSNPISPKAAAMKADLRSAAQEVESQNVDNLDYRKTIFGTGLARPGVSISSNGGAAFGTSRYPLSAGNTLTWVGGTATAFCLKATNPSSDSVWYYSSSAGGLTQSPCTAARP